MVYVLPLQKFTRQTNLSQPHTINTSYTEVFSSSFFLNVNFLYKCLWVSDILTENGFPHFLTLHPTCVYGSLFHF